MLLWLLATHLIAAQAAASPATLQPATSTRSGAPLPQTGDRPFTAEAMERLGNGWAGDLPVTWLPGTSKSPLSFAASSHGTWRDKIYAAANGFDRDHRTAWVEGKRGHGKGEWIEMRFPSPPRIRPLALLLVPGFAKNATMFARNGRPKIIQALIRCGREGVVLLDQQLQIEDARRAQLFALPPPAAAPPEGESDCALRLVVLQIYPGSHYQDTSLAEVALLVERSSR